MGHALEVGLDVGLGAVADEGPEEDVEGVGCEGDAVGLGPGEDAGEEGALVDVD